MTDLLERTGARYDRIKARAIELLQAGLIDGKSFEDLRYGTAKKQVDGTLQTPRITYGRNGEGLAF